MVIDHCTQWQYEQIPSIHTVQDITTNIQNLEEKMVLTRYVLGLCIYSLIHVHVYTN